MKGKYGNKAEGRLRVLESEALRDAHATINQLKQELAAARQELVTVQRDVQSKAMRAAAHLSADEKRILQHKIDELEHRSADERVRNAVVTWEVMHRHKFGRPAPLVSPVHRDRDEEAEESHQYWCSIHWEIAALFMTDFTEIQRFFEIAEGGRWKIEGSETMGLRDTDRWFNTRIRRLLMDRERDRRAYFERIWLAKKSGRSEPMYQPDVYTVSEDVKDDLVKKLKARRDGEET